MMLARELALRIVRVTLNLMRLSLPSLIRSLDFGRCMRGPVGAKA